MLVLFSEVELPVVPGAMVGSEDATDVVEASTDEVAPALVDVEDKTIVDETDEKEVVAKEDTDVAEAAVVLAASNSEEVELALGAFGGSSVESPSQVEYTAAYSTSSIFPYPSSVEELGSPGPACY